MHPLWHCLGSSYWGWVSLYSTHRNTTGHVTHRTACKRINNTEHSGDVHILNVWWRNGKRDKRQTASIRSRNKCITLPEMWQRRKQVFKSFKTINQLRVMGFNMNCACLSRNSLGYYTWHIYSFSLMWAQLRGNNAMSHSSKTNTDDICWLVCSLSIKRDQNTSSAAGFQQKLRAAHRMHS